MCTNMAASFRRARCHGSLSQIGDPSYKPRDKRLRWGFGLKLKIGALSAVDPLSVPLPSGTEVTTRVDRQLDDRRVPQGAIGRVVARDGDVFTVKVIGVGEVKYARDELVPRKLGQVAYAQRRAESWDALGACVVLETTVGSTAWGLAEAGSDVDRRGAFALPFSWTIGLRAPPEDLVSADASTNYWEARKLVRQGLRADPNTLETLFLPSARPLDMIGEWILAEKDAFASREIYASFGRYAISQLKKLSQSLRLAEHRTHVLAWLREDPSLTLDALARRLAKETIHDAPTERDAIERAREYVKQLYRSMHDQGLIAGTELRALADFAVNTNTDFELPRELRPKNAYNLLRLMRGAIDWLTTGQPSFVATGAFRDRLMAIKRGKVPLEDVLAEAESLAPELEQARASEALPEKADFRRADLLVRKISEELARRYVQKDSGPFGQDAPQFPLLEDE
jgi:hypothetical protein